MFCMPYCAFLLVVCPFSKEVAGLTYPNKSSLRKQWKEQYCVLLAFMVPSNVSWVRWKNIYKVLYFSNYKKSRSQLIINLLRYRSSQYRNGTCDWISILSDFFFFTFLFFLKSLIIGSVSPFMHEVL